LAVIQGMLYGIHADRDVASNTRAISAATAFSAGIWILVALPWFAFEKHRPGQRLPPGTNYFSAGIIMAISTAKKIWKLKQSLLYLCF
jgi:MFS-type transporter involved in bile tolerance (Atg22 family)